MSKEGSRSWQKNFLNSLTDFTGMYWYAQGTIPPKQRKSIFDDGACPIGHPGKWVPVIPMGANRQANQRLIEFFCWVLRLNLPEAMEVKPVITHEEMLKATSTKYYLWTDEITLDVACNHCGQITPLPHMLAEYENGWLCDECLQSGRWDAAGDEAAANEWTRLRYLAMEARAIAGLVLAGGDLNQDDEQTD
jgi:hypothetical protein